MPPLQAKNSFSQSYQPHSRSALISSGRSLVTAAESTARSKTLSEIAFKEKSTLPPYNRATTSPAQFKPKSTTQKSAAQDARFGDECTCGVCHLLISETRKQFPDFHLLNTLLQSDCCRRWLEVDGKLPLSVLHKAAQAGDVEATLAILKAGVPVNVESSLGRTALHYACSSKRTEVVMLLLSCEANINQPTLAGMTPLHLACQNNAEACVYALLNQTKQTVRVRLEDDDRSKAVNLTRSEAVRWLINEYDDSMGRLASRVGKETSPRLSAREFQMFGNKLENIIRESASLSSNLAQAKRMHAFKTLRTRFCPSIPWRIWLNCVLPYLGYVRSDECIG